MAKSVLNKELILLDLRNKKFKFYNISVESVGYNELQIIFHYGNVNNKGTKKLVKSESYKEAMAIAYQKFYEKKAENFEEVEDMLGWLGQSDSLNKKNREESTMSTKNPPSSKTKDKAPKNNDKKTEDASSLCDECGKSIKKEIYDEINKWGRAGGGWDKNPNFVGYHKVLCMKCQWKHDIFKKRL